MYTHNMSMGFLIFKKRNRLSVEPFDMGIRFLLSTFQEFFKKFPDEKSCKSHFNLVALHGTQLPCYG